VAAVTENPPEGLELSFGNVVVLWEKVGVGEGQSIEIDGACLHWPLSFRPNPPLPPIALAKSKMKIQHETCCF